MLICWLGPVRVDGVEPLRHGNRIYLPDPFHHRYRILFAGVLDPENKQHLISGQLTFELAAGVELLQTVYDSLKDFICALFKGPGFVVKDFSNNLFASVPIAFITP